MAPQKKAQAKAAQKASVPASAAPNDAEAEASSVSSPAKMDDEPKNDFKATPLICLNEATANFGTWEVCVVAPKMQNYTYTWDGQERKGTNFRCTLVSTDDDTQYCLAEVRKVKGSPANIFEKATKDFQESFRFRMSKVVLQGKAKVEYNNASCKFTVDLTATTMTKLLQTGTTMTPKPDITCADCLAINQAQAFDITALVESVSERRDIKDNRKVRDVYLIDGSSSSGATTPIQASSVASPAEEQEEKKMVRLKVAVYYDTDRKGIDPDFIKLIIDAKSSPKAIHFYGLSARAEGKGYIFETMRSGYVITPATGARAEKLVMDHAAILDAKTKMEVQTLETQWEEPDDYLINEEGQETFCAHLADMSKPTAITSLDAKPTLWQTNWVFPGLERGNMTNEKGNLWLTVNLEDSTGQVAVNMDEKTALSLSGHGNAENFLQAVLDGDPVFPTLVSAKIVRKLKRVSQDNEDSVEATEQETTYVNNKIISISVQDLTVPRTLTCLDLISMLRATASLSSAIFPVSLNMLMPSKLYPLLVKYPKSNLMASPCKKIWTIIKATKKSTCTDEPPYQVMTNDVQDALDMSDQEVKKNYNMITMCNKDNRPSLMLTPSHGKTVYALVVITAVDGSTLYTENVETIQEADKENLARAIRQEMTLVARLLEYTASQKRAKWDDTKSPLQSSKCRTLSRSPTGPELDPMCVDPPCKKPRTA